MKGRKQYIILGVLALFFIMIVAGCNQKSSESATVPSSSSEQATKTTPAEGTDSEYPEYINWIKSSVKDTFADEHTKASSVDFEKAGEFFGGTVLPEKINSWTLNKNEISVFEDERPIYKFVYEKDESLVEVYVEKTEAFQLCDESFDPAITLLDKDQFDPQTVSMIESLLFLLVQDTDNNTLYSQIVKVFPDPYDNAGELISELIDEDGNPGRVIITINASGGVSREQILEITKGIGF